MDKETEFFTLVGTQHGSNDGRSKEAQKGFKEDCPVVGSEAVGPIVIPPGEGAWAESDGKFWTTARSHKKLPVGFYRMDVSPTVGPMFLSIKNDTDNLIVFPDSESDKIIEEIQQFKHLRHKFKENGFLYKRGILMWGPPGSGKTATLQMLVKLLMEQHDSVAVMVENPSEAAACLQALRRIEPDRQIVAIMEDLDSLLQRYCESEYLSLLDGEAQVDNIVFVATTNYPERLDKRFTDRPSRFDTVRYIGMPSANARRVYFCAKMDLNEGLLEQYVSLSDGYSVAHLRELIILTQCFGIPLTQAVKRLNKSRGAKHNSESSPDKPSFGFVQSEV